MLSLNDNFSKGFTASIPLLTANVESTVRINVQISITSKIFTSLTESKIPAMTGETRYLALPARETSPLAFEYSSGVNKSETVALYAGSRNEENTADIDTPIQICVREASPLIMQIKI